MQGVNVNINYLWAALMFVFPMIGAVAYVHSSRLSIIVQIKMRAELTAAVYRKALALSSRSAQYALPACGSTWQYLQHRAN